MPPQNSMDASQTFRSCVLLVAVALALLSPCKVGLADEAVAVAERPEGAGEGDVDVGTYPRPDSGYVTDLADMLSRDEEERIERLLWRAEEEKGVEIAVLTIDSLQDYPGTANQSIESFATEVFNRYRIGNLPKNDGVLLLVSKRDRKMRIELGTGWARNRDPDAARIIDRDIKPHFKAERYGAGIEAGAKAIVTEFAGVAVADAATTGFPWMMVAIVAGGLIVAAFVTSLFRSGRSGWGWLVMVLAGAGLFALFRALEQHGRRMQGPSGNSNTWSSGGFGDGFGGGSSDGGGASGDW